MGDERSFWFVELCVVEAVFQSLQHVVPDIGAGRGRRFFPGARCSAVGSAGEDDVDGVGGGWVGNAAGGHVGVADGFDFLDVVAGDDFIEEAEVVVELGDELAGVEFLGDGGEADGVGEHDGGGRVAAAFDAIVLLELVGDGRGGARRRGKRGRVEPSPCTDARDMRIVEVLGVRSIPVRTHGRLGGGEVARHRGTF